MLHAEAFLSSTRIACGFFSMRIKKHLLKCTGRCFYFFVKTAEAAETGEDFVEYLSRNSGAGTV